MSDWSGVPEEWGKGHYRDVPISKFVRLARERQVRDLGRQRTPEFPYYYDDEAADRAVWFFSRLKLWDGEWAGKPFLLSDWQEWDIVRPLYGWKRCSDGYRRFRRLILKVGRKNTKTTLAAGMALFAMNADGEVGAQCFAAATKEEQARISWDIGLVMAEISPLLRNEVKASKKQLYNPHLRSFFRPLGRDSKTQDGFRVHFGLIDELHAHKTKHMVGVLKTGTVASRQPLIVITSTEGLEKGALRDEERVAKRILEDPAVSDEQYLIYICEVDDPANWEDEREWFKANPQLGLSIKLEDLRGEYQSAKLSMEDRIQFMVKNLNIACSSSQKWMPAEVFKRCDGPVDWKKFVGKRCYAAIDLGKTGDLSCLSLAFMDEADGKSRMERATHLLSEEELPRIYTRRFYWCPEEGLVARWKNDGVCYPAWRDQGWIETSPGSVNRNDLIRKKLNELALVYEIAEVAADNYNCGDLLLDLENDGFTVLKHPQTMMGFTLPVKTYEKLIKQGRLRHNDDPVLKWMVPNAVAVTDGNENIKLMKNKSPDRIDGLVADIMAVGRLTIAPEPVRNPYNERGMFVA